MDRDKGTERVKRLRGISFAILACMATLALLCRFEVAVGGLPETSMFNGFYKVWNSFSEPDFLDIVVFGAVLRLLWTVADRDNGIYAGTAFFSLLLAGILVTSISFKKYNNGSFLIANKYQVLLSGFCIIGFGVLIYLTLRTVYYLFERELKEENGRPESFKLLRKHFGGSGALIIFICWLPWILLNYPGTGMPDTFVQLQQFLGESEWTAWQPPLSSYLMGILFTMGSRIADANFGCFLYCLLHTCVGAWVFSLSMRKLYDMGISFKWCMTGILFFALTPLWGAYAQWFEKDLLYAEITLLQAVCMLEVVKKKECSLKAGILLALSGILSCFLRNNGIYALIPALIVLAVFVKKVARRRVVTVLVVTLVVYGGVTKGIYPALGIGGAPISEALSIPFQQTARYVCYFGDEVTDYEKEVIDNVLSYDNLINYNPVISDPIKNCYKGGNLAEYFDVWFGMFLKHPGSYMAAIINKSYGYIAPVSQDIGAWVGRVPYDYEKEKGIYHVFGENTSEILRQSWNISLHLPLIRYLCTPGLYSWILLVLAALLIRHRKFGALIMLVPSLMNLLVCIASPLASAMRYELPIVATIPLLIGWTYYSLHERGNVDSVCI